jgi:hypothetical protein
MKCKLQLGKGIFTRSHSPGEMKLVTLFYVVPHENYGVHTCTYSSSNFPIWQVYAWMRTKYTKCTVSFTVEVEQGEPCFGFNGKADTFLTNANGSRDNDNKYYKTL